MKGVSVREQGRKNVNKNKNTFGFGVKILPFKKEGVAGMGSGDISIDRGFINLGLSIVTGCIPNISTVCSFCVNSYEDSLCI